MDGRNIISSNNMNGNKMVTKEDENEKLSMPHLPEEMIVEILSRLPPRFLLRFRCVSKPWSILFNNPILIDMIKNNFSIMLRCGNDMYSIDNESLSSSSLLDGFEKIHCPVVDNNNNYFGIIFLACCNGLFCIRTTQWNDFILWNPSTGDYKRIPNPPGQSQVDDDSLHFNKLTTRYGFGYDSKTDDYKFVCITSYLNLSRSEAMIYSLRSDSWKLFKRRAQHIPWLLCRTSLTYGVFCNGALHWKTASSAKVTSSSKALIALHMTDELTKEILPPENSNFDKYGNTACIDVVDGCLCLLLCKINLGFEVWLMKDYGKTESWTRIYSISKPPSLEMQRFGNLRRIKCLKTGELLLEVYFHIMHEGTREALVLYDPKNETSTVLKYTKDHWSCDSLSFHTYVKSSFSVSH